MLLLTAIVAALGAAQQQLPLETEGLFSQTWAGFARSNSLPTSFDSANKTFRLSIDFQGQKLALVNQLNQATIWTKSWQENAAPTGAFISNDGDRVVLFNHVRWSPGCIVDSTSTKVLYILNGSGEVVQQYWAQRLDLGKSLSPLDRGLGDRTGLSNAEFIESKDLFRAIFAANAAPFGQDRMTFVPIGFNIRSGEQVRLSPEQHDQMLARLRAETKTNFDKETDAYKRLWILQDAAALEEGWALPHLLAYLDDPTSTGTGSTDGNESGPRYDYQYMAGRGLARLDKKLAQPLLQEKLRHVKPTNQQMEWLRVLAEAGLAPDEQTALRLAASKDYLVRHYLLESVRDSRSPYAAKCARIAVAHERSRWNAFQILMEMGDEQDAVIAEQLMPSVDVNWTAVRTFTRHANTKALARHAKDERSPARWESLNELAKRNNPWALKSLVSLTESAATNPKKFEKFLEEFGATCEVFVSRNPAGAVAALEHMMKANPSYWWADILAAKALVKLGQPERLVYLRAVAKGTPPKQAPTSRYNTLSIDFDGRETAARCLSELKDIASIPIFEAMTKSDDVITVMTGKRALEAVESRN